MKVSELDRIESELNVRLPDRYRTAMIVGPFKEYQELARRYMPNDSDYVLNLNKSHSVIRERPLPAGFVAIGESGDELFVLNTNHERGSVMAFHVKTFEVRELASNFDDWIQLLRRWQNGEDAMS